MRETLLARCVLRDAREQVTGDLVIWLFGYLVVVLTTDSNNGSVTSIPFNVLAKT